jgi:WD repeat-containing protein 19
MLNLQETVKIITISDQAALKNVDWSPDGQLMAVTSSQGAISVFVTKLQSIYAVSAPRIAILSSLAEVGIYHYTPDKIKMNPTTVTLEMEPTFIAIGRYNLACGMNNRVWFYDLGRSTDNPIMLGDREYMSEIKQIQLNTDYCAVLCGSQIMLHSIENAPTSQVGPLNNISQDRDPKIFPEEIHGLHDTIITCLNLTNDFLCFGTDVGHLIHFSLEHWSTIIQYRHTIGIKSIFTDMEGTRLAFIDDHNEGFVYMPVR